MMRRLGWPVNAKRVRRWMEELGIDGAPPKRRQRTTNSNHSFPRYPNLVKDLEITRPDHVWVADITYIRLRHEFVYLAVLMDVFTRSIRGWHLAATSTKASPWPPSNALSSWPPRPSITPIRACSTRPPPMSSACRPSTFSSAWRPSASLAKMVMPNASCAPSRKSRPRLPVDDIVVAADKTKSVAVCPWALLELARVCQEYRAVHGGSEPCLSPSPPSCPPAVSETARPRTALGGDSSGPAGGVTPPAGSNARRTPRSRRRGGAA